MGIGDGEAVCQREKKKDLGNLPVCSVGLFYLVFKKEEDLEEGGWEEMEGSALVSSLYRKN